MTVLVAERWASWSRWLVRRRDRAAQGGTSSDAESVAPSAEEGTSSDNNTGPQPLRSVVGSLPPAWRPSVVREDGGVAPAAVGAPVLPPMRVTRPAVQSEEIEVEGALGADDAGSYAARACPSPGAAGAVWDEVVYGLDRGLGLLMDDDPLHGEGALPSEEDHHEEVGMEVLDDWHDDDRSS